MIRLIVFLIAVALVAAGLSWLADRPGELVVQWQGYQIETSVFRAIIIFALLFAVTVLAWSVLRHVWFSPASVSNFFTRRRQKRGLEALSSGMIALGAGDRAAATRSAIQARKSLPNEPLTHLLRAHAAQLSGDSTTARRIFEAMLASPDTEQLGLRGLYLEARRVGEIEAARHFAERAVALNPKLDWAVDALFDLQCRQGNWDGALDTLAIASKQGHIERTTADRRRAILLAAQAQAAEEDNPERALHLAVEANGLAPDLVPAATIAGRLLAARGNTPRAAKILQKTWSRSPHPDLATTYAYARIGDSPRDRLDRVKQLAALTPNSIEGPIAVATAAIEARQFDDARSALKPLLEDRMTQRVATLMARIEGEEHGDKGRVREWLARAVNAPRDPAWTADGVVAEHWSPVSPVTGTLDAFRWRVPVEPIEKREGEVLASKLEELVTLGAPREMAVSGKMVPAKAAPTDMPETIEVAPVKTEETRPETSDEPILKPAAKVLADPAPHAGQEAGASTPVPGQHNDSRREPEPRRKTRKEAARTAESHVYVAPHAPDDPGPQTGDQDDVSPPLRPQRA
jgi:HemY protein